MILIFSVVSVIIIGLFCLPGLKCIGYCKYKRSRFDKYSKKLEQVEKFKEMSLKELKQIYKHTTPFGCKTFSDHGWNKFRTILKNEIADRELLEQI